VGDKNRIVNLSSRAGQSDPSSDGSALPLLVDQICKLFVEDLDTNLKIMFEQADDFLFDMSDSGYDNARFDAMRMLRIKKDGLKRSFNHEINLVFVKHLATNRSQAIPSAPENEIFSFENIALVEDSDLEEGIAIDAMVKKARADNLDAIELIRFRLDTLITSHTLSSEKNPFEPAFICAAFKKAGETLDIDIQSQLVVYKLFERIVLSGLQKSYDKLNRFFVEKGVLPELKIRSRSSTSSGAPSQSKPGGLNDFAAAVNQTTSSDNEIDVLNSKDESLLGLMQSLLAQARGYQQASSPTTVPQSAQIQSNQIHPSTDQVTSGASIATSDLLAALTQLQASVTRNSSQPGIDAAEIREAVGSQLNLGAQAAERNVIGDFNDDMINIVSMLFDFILDDKNLHVEIKSIIARLQIPMLKVGLVDRKFFSNRNHPARLLLNEIAHTGISWDPADVEAEATLTKIESISESIIREFDQDISLFQYLLDDFTAFRNKAKKRADIFERRTREAEEGKARAESARGTVNSALEKICQGKLLPDSAKNLLKNVWVHVMFLERLKHDQDGWERACQVAKLLVWSVQPIEEAAALEKLVSHVPKLVKNLRKGFAIISTSPIDATHMLDQLEATHRKIISEAQTKIEEDSKEQILRLSPAPVVPELDPVPDSAVSALDSEQNRSQNMESSFQRSKSEEEEKIEIFDIGFAQEAIGENRPKVEPVNITQGSLQAIESLRAGHWVELMLEGKLQRCKLAAKISSSGKFIFVNRSGVKVAEFFTDEIAYAYQIENLKILDDEALFDRALESVISNLRDMKAQA